MKNKIDKFFNPKIIAVIGANDRENSPGFSIYKNIKSEFKGKVFAVNISVDTVQGDKAYRSLKDIPEQIDLAIIATPAPTVIGLLEECGKLKITSVVIISSGFLEVGGNGKELFKQIKLIGNKYGIKILGPNCLGFINPQISLNASFAPVMPNKGGVAFISQSGALCNTFLDWSIHDCIGYSYFVSIGSMADISFDELIDYFNDCPEVNSILLYVESVNDGQKFMKSVRNFSKSKPIIILKAGIGMQGAKAVASHTGTIAGDDRIFDTVFKDIGAIRVGTISELYNYAKILNKFKNPAGGKLTIITNAGGPAVIATDYLITHGGTLTEISPETINRLDSLMPPAWSRGNPLDLLGDAQPIHYQEAVKACLNDSNTDGIMIILTPQAITDTEGIAKAVVALPEINKKPVFASFMGDRLVDKGIDILLNGGIPVFRTPEQAIRCFLGIQEWQNQIKTLNKEIVIQKSLRRQKKRFTKQIIDEHLKDSQLIITGNDAKNILNDYKITVNPAYAVKNTKEAIKIADKIGYPVAMKIEIRGLLHKTEIGGVELGIQNAKEVEKAFNKLTESSTKVDGVEALVLSNVEGPVLSNVEGITVEKMATKKYELFVGSKRDPIFGPVIIFGMGGIGVEVYNDTAIGLLPLNVKSAESLIGKTKIGVLLKGYRNQKSADMESIKSALVRLSSLVLDFPEIKEVDINPLFADENGVIVVDAKIILNN